MLETYEPRYDPTVIPITDETRAVGLQNILGKLPDRPSEKLGHNHSIADYHYAFKSGKLTPLAVAHALLELIQGPSRHSVAFLAVRKARILAEAEESTKRYREGTSLSMLDGVPVAVKDEADLAGCSKSLGSSRSFTGPSENTSWCVQKWEKAGAIVMGKLNMHEIGLGTAQLLYLCFCGTGFFPTMYSLSYWPLVNERA